VFIIWDEASSKSALIADEECWGMFDLASEKKLSAPRESNVIIPIKMETWTERIGEDEGEVLSLDVGPKTP